MAKTLAVDVVVVGRKIVAGPLQAKTVAPLVVEALQAVQAEVEADSAEAVMKEETEALAVAAESTVQPSECHNPNNHGPVRIYPRLLFRLHRRHSIHY